MNPVQREERRAFNKAVRARIRLIATERGLPKDEVKRVLGRLKHYDLMLFMERHWIDADWLICGDLRGYLETVRGCPSRFPQRRL
jgi:hypothetical protein